MIDGNDNRIGRDVGFCARPLLAVAVACAPPRRRCERRCATNGARASICASLSAARRATLSAPSSTTAPSRPSATSDRRSTTSSPAGTPRRWCSNFARRSLSKPDGIAMMGHPGDAAIMPLAEEASKSGIKMMYQNVPVPKVVAKFGGGYVGAQQAEQGHALGVEAVKRGRPEVRRRRDHDRPVHE